MKCLVGIVVLFLVQVDPTFGGFTNSPTVTSIYEDDNAAKLIWDIGVTCTRKNTIYHQQSYSECAWSWWGSCIAYNTIYYSTVSYSSTTGVACTNCVISNPDTRIFFDYNNAIYRYSCGQQCRDCTSYTGCLDYDVTDSYSFSVTCSHSTYPDARHSKSFTVSITENTAPSIGGGDATVYKMNAGVLAWDAQDYDSENDATFTFSSAPDVGYSGLQLWSLESTTGDIYTAYSTHLEYSKKFYFRLCASDRRQDVCKNIVLTMDTCFEIADCSDISRSDIDDTFANGGTLFQQTKNNPTGLFASDFSSSWPNRVFTIHDDDGLGVGVINSVTGDVTTNGNITVHPSYPTKTFTMTIKVREQTSCWDRYCTNTLTVTFKNWPIEIRSLPASGSLVENTDIRTAIHYLISFDWNYNSVDNVTCGIVGNPDADMFELVADRALEHEAYTLWKKECQNAGCGYACAAGTGCMNADSISSYAIPIRCADGYGTSALSTFTFNVEENAVPQFKNFPAPGEYHQIGKLSSGAEAFGIEWSDAEGDTVEFYWGTTPNLSYEYANQLFTLDANTGSITTTKDLSDEFSYYFSMNVCMRDRRWYNCTDLKFRLTSCYDRPTCSDQTGHDFYDTHPIGDTLFTMQVPLPRDHFPDWYPTWPGMTFDLTDQADLDVGQIDPISGILNTNDNITVHPTHFYKNYILTVTVANEHSCETTTCTMDMTVGFVNWPIEIRSLPASGSLPENTDIRTVIHYLITFDWNYNYMDNVTCGIVGNPDSDMFELVADRALEHEAYTLWKKECQNAGCGYACAAGTGCMNADSISSYEIPIACADGYGTFATSTFTFNVEENAVPQFTNLPTPDEYHPIGKLSSGAEAFGVEWYDAEGDTVEFYWGTEPNLSYEYGIQLFTLDANTGSITTTKDLSDEFSYYFSMNVCMNDRRWYNCTDLKFNLTSCYDRPTCYHQEFHEFYDTHPIGDTLFTMQVPVPRDHFPDWYPTWPGMTFTLTDQADLVVGQIDAISGVLNTNENITVHPTHYYKNYILTVTVANEHSCETTTCTMNMTVGFINWNIRLPNLPASDSLHEDYDSEYLLLFLETYDYNKNEHDNVTCMISDNPDDSLFELRRDRLAAGKEHETYTLWKNECLIKECGFFCEYGNGCMNYDVVSSYVVEITCDDGYNSSATDYFTLYVLPNEPPVLDLPAERILNSDHTANGDLVFFITYTDAENEDLYYNYTITPTTDFFAMDAWGNYHNSLANITLTQHHWSHNTNYSFTFYICGTERRNIVCGNLVVKIQNNCDDDRVPTCADDDRTISDQFTVGDQLFQVNVPNPASGSHNQLTFAIASSAANYLALDSSSGIITSSAVFQPGVNNATYYISVFVYDSEACQYGTCTLRLDVTYTNHPIVILNLPATINLSEDEKGRVIAFTLSTQDDNTDDTVVCIVDDLASTPANNGIFFTLETYSGSQIFNIISKDQPGFDADATPSYTVRVMCFDALGAYASGDLTVQIDRNEEQQFVGLDPVAGHSLQFDLTTLTLGDTLYTVAVTDPEGDAITFSYDPVSSSVPMICDENGRIYLRSALTESDKDSVHTLNVHAVDAVHDYTISVLFTFTFVILNTKPVISDPPTGLSFAETDPAGTSIYTVVVVDPDPDPITVTFTVSPASATSMFNLDPSSFELTLGSGKSFDFESQSTYTFTFSAHDGTAAAELTKSLTIAITNVNEAPEFTLATTSVSIPEGPASATVLATLDYTCEDVDIADTLTVAITHTSFFDLTTDNGQLKLSYNADWDLEAGKGTSTTLTIACSDAGGLSDQAVLSVTIYAVNEFAPVPAEAYVELSISGDTKITDVLHTITATDADHGDDGVFDFSVLGVGEGQTYFTVNANGQLLLKNELGLRYDRLFVFTVKVSDGETSPLFGTVAFNVSYTSTYTPPTPVRPTYCTLCTLKGRVVVACIIIEGLMLLAFLAYVIQHFVRGAYCPSKGDAGRNANQRFRNTKQRVRQMRRQKRKERKRQKKEEKRRRKEEKKREKEEKRRKKEEQKTNKNQKQRKPQNDSRRPGPSISSGHPSSQRTRLSGPAVAGAALVVGVAARGAAPGAPRFSHVPSNRGGMSNPPSFRPPQSQRPSVNNSHSNRTKNSNSRRTDRSGRSRDTDRRSRRSGRSQRDIDDISIESFSDSSIGSIQEDSRTPSPSPERGLPEAPVYSFQHLQQPTIPEPFLPPVYAENLH